ncbi:stage III sporulation protein AE [Thermoanaerobacterium aotearoense SCUT27]|uniref:Stage III sporulation protein AE n=2 Tax=Thermoanaerobacterium TaxID=28895 RepID=W9EAY5_9THEO|nr:stage III sporulation protein AE [Thermoanaerobacterium saccharolyticum JW/SL-YS485]ETO39253.1 stage III sporulation protein AE [Thermoanaerobacterium aotearoense SCUT27]
MSPYCREVINVRKTLCLIFILTIVSMFPMKIYADTKDDLYSQISSADTSQIDSLIKGINEKNGNVFQITDVKTYLYNLLNGKETFSVKNIVNGILNIFFNEVKASVEILIQLILLAIIGAVLTNLENSFENGGISQVAHMAVYIVLVIVAIKSFMSVLNIGKDAIDSMVNFMQAILPVLITMLASVGAFVSASFFQPALVMIVEFTAKEIRDFILPAILFMTAIRIISRISDKFTLNKLADLFKTICTASISILLSIFIGVLTIQGITSSLADGVISRTTKYAVGAFLPVVGSILSDSIDTIMSASLLIKGAISTFGLIAIVLMAIVPIIKIFSVMIIYKLSAAVVEPIADKKIVDFLSDISTSVAYVFAALVSVTVMMFLAITAVINASSISVMMR